MQLLKWIKSLFDGSSYQDALDQYIASKNPTTVAEVEYWTTVFQQRNGWML